MIIIDGLWNKNLVENYVGTKWYIIFTKAEALELVKQLIANAVYQQTSAAKASVGYRCYR